MATSQDVPIIRILEDLGDEDFKEFKVYLGDYKSIPKSKLEKADRADTSVKIKETYPDPETALEIIMNILKEINRNDLVQMYSFTGPPSKAETRADQTEDTTGRGGRHHESEGASAGPGVQVMPGKPVRPAEFYRHTGNLIHSGSLSVYKLPLEKNNLDIDGCKSYRFGKKSTSRNRTIIVIGATGSGKTTLINGMINYIFDVKWGDSFRFKLDDEETKSQAVSQTSEITVYKINHQEGFQIDYSLTIVDTPGFGDTRGTDRDRLITEQLNNLFTAKRGVSEIDAVCFVAQASLARLTATERYVFDSVSSLFGKDIEQNIRVLVTFADSQPPPVLQAIKASGVPCSTKEGQPLHFKFNNSALFAANKSPGANNADDDDDDDDSEDYFFDKMFWDMGFKSMKNFFKALNQMQTKTLTLTKEVIRERQMLKNSVESLRTQVSLGLAKIEQIRQTTQILDKYESEIRANENFEIEITIVRPVQNLTKGYNLNCQQCNVTCYSNWSWGKDEDKYKCPVIGSDGYCTACTMKCHWRVHFLQKYTWDYVNVREKRMVKEMKDKYENAKRASIPLQELISELKADYEHLQNEVVKLMEESSKCLDGLKEKALRPNPLFDMLIKAEHSECRPGYMDRIKSLQEIKEKAEYMAKVEKGEPLLSDKN